MNVLADALKNYFIMLYVTAESHVMAKYKYIDLFSGCGGLSCGLGKAGWTGMFALELNPMAYKTFEHNLLGEKSHFDWPDWLPAKHHDVNAVIRDYKNELEALRGSVDLVAGGPPCQGFSMAGKRNRLDDRNILIHSYLKFVDIVQPKAIFFENVAGITQRFRDEDGEFCQCYSDEITHKLRELGYSVCSAKILNLADYGLPQSRRRFIMVAFKDNVRIDFFQYLSEQCASFLKNKGLGKKIGVQAALSDLRRSHGVMPCPDGGRFESGRYGKPTNAYQRLMRTGTRSVRIADSHRFPNHESETIKVFEKLLSDAPRNVGLRGDDAKTYGVKKRNVTILGSRQPSPTILSIPDDYIHYEEARIMTVRECARLQTFPDDFEFLGKYTSGGKMRKFEVPRYTQVGNAIPPLFAEQVGLALAGIFKNERARRT